MSETWTAKIMRQINSAIKGQSIAKRGNSEAYVGRGKLHASDVASHGIVLEHGILGETVLSYLFFLPIFV